MPVSAYSWREDKVVPMLTDEEWTEVSPLIEPAILSFKEYRTKTGASIQEARTNTHFELHAKFKEITGETLEDIFQIYLRQRSAYGELCTKCDKPLRTPKASYCVYCGETKLLSIKSEVQH